MSLIKGRSVEKIVAPLTRIRGELEVVVENADRKIEKSIQSIKAAEDARDAAIRKAHAQFKAVCDVQTEIQDAAEKEIQDANSWLDQLPVAP